jgi:TonB-linked SusC/RagA family outer membrane protein
MPAQPAAAFDGSGTRPPQTEDDMMRGKTQGGLAGLRSVLIGTMLFAANLSLPAAAAAQTGTVTGRVLSVETGEPLVGAQILVEGTDLGAITRANGRFLILQIPAGTHTVSATLIGYGRVSRSVTVTPGDTAQMDLRLEPRAVALSEIVVTGVAGATQRTKLPFEVAQVRARDLPVASVNAGSILTGKVAGVTVHQGSGRPGSAPSMLLRGVTSLDASGRDQEPLFIVDGVILGEQLMDLDALDIESVEIIKGAAAASLYGSRAQNGVVQIRTKRGAAMANDQIRYTVRSEYGRSELASVPDNLLTQSHEYAMSSDGQRFITTQGEECEWLLCGGRPALAGNASWRAAGSTANQWNTVQSVAWPGRTYDQVERFFQQGDFLQNYLSAEGRAGATNFHVSVSNLQEDGVMPGRPGFDRTNFRVNVDQSMSEKLNVQASAFYSRSEQGEFPENQGNPMFQLTRMPAGVDLTSEDPFVPGDIVLNVDIANQEQPNPLYEMYNREFTEERTRFLGSLNVRYSPLTWMDLDLNGSFDRADRSERDYRPKGYRTITASATTNEGNLRLFERFDEALNASITATLRRDLGENVRNTTQFRYLYEDQYRETSDVGGYEFAVGDVPTIDNLNTDNISGGSFERTIRADGYFALTNFDIYDKYVVDALVRNDGSSLFGADERRQWYYRVAGAWRLSQEPFFNVPGVDEFKLRYSVGTAGGRPRFEAQYETYSVGGGRVTPVTLGNRSLKPEFSTEHEAGIDAAFFNNRVSLGLTYARARTTDQILPVPLPSFAGFGSQWQNAGTVESKTWEASLDMSLVDTRDFSWSTKVLFDRTKSKVTELNRPAFQYGVTGQGLGNVFYFREGEEVGTFYGRQAATSCAHLPTGVSCDGFAVNDDGLLVWVGSGGLASNQWGTDSDVTVRGARVKWGTPFIGECTDPDGERVTFCPLGNTIPDFTLNVSQNFRFKGLNLYALVSHVNGFDVYNQPLQWATFAQYSGIMEQTGIPAGQQKPIGYYVSGLYQGLGGLNPSSPFIEDATFTKLREVSLSYRFNAQQLSGIPGLNRASGLGLSLTGRNLFTITDYRGYDPEVGKQGGDTGSSAIARVDGYQYPNFRTFTAAIELIF